MCKDLKLIALAIDENFSEFLTFLASTLWGRGVFTFSLVKFYHLTASRASKIMP
jgi:hypothetical protein